MMETLAVANPNGILIEMAIYQAIAIGDALTASRGKYILLTSTYVTM